jgi:uncharacterized protein with PIN domain
VYVTLAGRADAEKFAGRVNAAVELLASGVTVAEVARVLAERFAVSVRQGRRYADRAAAGRVAVPEATVVFTVKLPASLVVRTRAHAKDAGATISALVAAALTGYLQPDRTKRPQR